MPGSIMIEQPIITLLLTEHDHPSAELVRAALETAGYGRFLLRYRGQLDEALGLLKAGGISLVILPSTMTHVEVMLAIARIRQSSLVPILVAADHDDLGLAAQAIREGAQDCMFISDMQVHRLIRAAIFAIERNKSLKNLQEINLRHWALCRIMNEGIAFCKLSFDESGQPVNYKILESNPAWAAMIGTKQTDIPGAPLLDVCAATFKTQSTSCTEVYVDLTKKHLIATGFPMEPGESGSVGLILRDVTEQKLAEDRMRRDAFYDRLTALPNRSLFLNLLDQALKHSRRREDDIFAVILIDIDRFRTINVRFGHNAGDNFLVETGKRLDACLRGSDILARVHTEETIAHLGGDEFAVLIQNARNGRDVAKIAERLQAAIAVPIEINEEKVLTSATIGIVVGTRAYKKAEDILRDADTALRRAKSRGTPAPGYEIFGQEMHQGIVNRLRLENELRQAIHNEEFRVYYQPLISLKNGTISGFEALVRWEHPTQGLVSPLKFIPVAEETGMIIAIGFYVLKQACKQLHVWQTQYNTMPHPLTVNVNLSAKQFLEPSLVQQIAEILNETSISPQFLTLELTESVVMEQGQNAQQTLRDLKKLNIQLSIDDFGTGYSSLSYLHRLPIDSLKVDRSFVSQMKSDAKNMEIVRTIISLARNLGISVTAEGIEKEEQLLQLRAMDCGTGQGYYFSKPLSDVDATKLLATSPKW